MLKLASVGMVGLALLAVGCEQNTARPAEAPHAPPPAATPTPPTPPAPPAPPPGDHAGGPGWPHHGEDHDASHAMNDHGPPGMHNFRAPPGPGPRGMERGGPPEHGGNAEMARELEMLGVRFYPGAMLIRRAKEIGLTPEQVSKIRAEMLATQSKSIDLHAKVEHARVESARLLAADKVDEKAVDAQIDEATKAEAEMHKLHVGAMLRVRALLTPEQRQKLDEKPARKARKHGGPKAGAPGQVGGVPGHAPDDDEDDEEEDDDA